MENLDKFLNQYLKVEEPTKEEIQKAENDLKEAKKKVKPGTWGASWEFEWKLNNLKRKIGRNKYRYMTHSRPARNIARNLLDDNIVAYTKDRFMGIVIIKGKRNFFAFIVRDREMNMGGYGYSIMDIDLKRALQQIEKLLVEYPKGTKIKKPELWQQFKNSILINAIDNSG